MLLIKILGVLLGVLEIIGGVECIYYPFSTATVISMAIPLFVGITMLLNGILSFVRWGSKKKAGEKDALLFLSALFDVVLGLFLTTSAGAQFVFALSLEVIIPYVAAAWLLGSGVIAIVRAFQLRKLNDTLALFGKKLRWFWLLVLGVLLVLFGIQGILNPILMLTGIGISVGMDILFHGVALIFLTLAVL